MPNKSPEEHYRELYDTIVAIPDDQVAPINMPPEEAMHEGERVAALSEKYKDRLLQSAIDPKLLKTVDARAEAYAYSVAQCDIYIKDESENKELFQEKKREGYALRSKIMKSFDYTFRKNPQLLERVQGIKEGRGNLEMVKDLLSECQLGTEQKEMLQKAKFEMALLEQSKNLYEELSELMARIAIDPDKINEANDICSKAWTYLKEALVEIYAAGRYVFMDESDIEELFYIDYIQEKNKMALRQKAESTTEGIAM